MINGLSFDIEEWFQVENLRAACPLSKWDSFESRVERSTDLLLEILDQYGFKATFFILGWVAEQHTALVKKIADKGHEIASHGYQHELVYDLTPEQFREDSKKSKKILEDIVGKEVIGYRAPNFSMVSTSLWAIDILKELNFQYDSSIFPTSFHDRYGCRGVYDSDSFTFKNGIKEFPLTVYKIGRINFPVGGGAYFRFLPYGLFRWLLRNLNRKGKRCIFYLHPWEFDSDQPRVKIKKQYSLRHYTNLATTQEKFKHLLQEFQFKPLRDLLHG